MKAIWIDVETTGLDPKTNGLIQVAGLIEVNNIVVETFNIRCRPLIDDKIDEEALIHNGLSEAEIMTWPIAQKGLIDFRAILSRYVNQYTRTDKFTFYAYNAHFDADFLRQWFYKQGDKYYGSWFFVPPIDIMSIAGYLLRKERAQLPNFRLSTICDYLGLKDDGKYHDALFDIQQTRKVLVELDRRIIERFRIEAQL